MAEQDHPCGREARPGVAVPVGDLVENPARGGERLPGDGVEVLQPDRDPAEVGCAACGQPLAGTRRPLERILLVDADPGVHRARVAIVRVGSVSLPDPGKARLHELARGERSASQCLAGVHDAEIGRIVHGAIISCATNIVDEPIVAALDSSGSMRAAADVSDVAGDPTRARRARAAAARRTDLLLHQR
jgi:hypothetical protein